jgi:hypothetical protein
MSLSPESQEPERIRQRLELLPPRSAQALTLRLVDRRSREECARFYGIRPEAFDVMLLRAARLYASEHESVGRPETLLRAPPAPPLDEQEQAACLAQELERRTSTSKDVGELAQLLQGILAQSTEVRRQLEAAELAYEGSSKFRREIWFRRIAIFAIIALTLFFYLRGDEPARLTPRTPAPKISP